MRYERASLLTLLDKKVFLAHHQERRDEAKNQEDCEAFHENGFLCAMLFCHVSYAHGL